MTSGEGRGNACRVDHLRRGPAACRRKAGTTLAAALDSQMTIQSFPSGRSWCEPAESSPTAYRPPTLTIRREGRQPQAKNRRREGEERKTVAVECFPSYPSPSVGVLCVSRSKVSFLLRPAVGSERRVMTQLTVCLPLAVKPLILLIPSSQPCRVPAEWRLFPTVSSGPRKSG